jgi:cellobiose phosphorylase
VTLTNESGSDADLSLFSAIEFCLWDANDDATNFQRNYSIGQVEIVDDVIYHKTEYRERRDHFRLFRLLRNWQASIHSVKTSSVPIAAGMNRMVVEDGESCNSIAHGWQPIGSHHVKVR